MMFHSFRNFCYDAFKNVLLNKLMSLATVITLAAGIFLFGLTLTVTLNVFSVTDKLKTDFKLVAFLEEDIDSQKINEIGLQIQALANVQGIEFVSREDAYEDFKKSFGETDILDGINDGSILRNSFKITLVDLRTSKEVSESVKSIAGISKVTEMEDAMTRFMDISKSLQLGTILISVILCLLSVLIITNTINMSIFSRRKQINIMKYVGATDWYIRWPFLIEGLIIGVISSVIAYLGVFFLYNVFISSTGIYGNMMGFLERAQAMPLIGAIVLGIGLILGCMGSILSVRKHLKV